MTKWVDLSIVFRMFTRGYLTCKHHQEVFGDLNEDTAKPAKSSWSSHFFLVGGISTPLKNMKVSWDEYFQYMGKIKAMFQTTNQFLCNGNKSH